MFLYQQEKFNYLEFEFRHSPHLLHQFRFLLQDSNELHDAIVQIRPAIRGNLSHVQSGLDGIRQVSSQNQDHCQDHPGFELWIFGVFWELDLLSLELSKVLFWEFLLWALLWALHQNK